GRRPTGRYLALVFGFGCASGAAALGNGLSVFGNTLLAHLLTNVNAQATALPFFAGAFCAFAALARAGLRRSPGSWGQWGALCLSLGLLCVGKVPQSSSAACGPLATQSSPKLRNSAPHCRQLPRGRRPRCCSAAWRRRSLCS